MWCLSQPQTVKNMEQLHAMKALKLMGVDVVPRKKWKTNLKVIAAGRRLLSRGVLSWSVRSSTATYRPCTSWCNLATNNGNHRRVRRSSREDTGSRQVQTHPERYRKPRPVISCEKESPPTCSRGLSLQRLTPNSPRLMLCRYSRQLMPRLWRESAAD